MLPQSFWAEAFAAAAYLQNRSPKRCLNMKTPEEIWTGNKLDISNLRVFGCVAYSLALARLNPIMGAKSGECIMIGYSTNRKAHRLWDPVNKRMIDDCHVRFLENSNKKTVGVNLPIDEPAEATVKPDADQSDDDDAFADAGDNNLLNDLFSEDKEGKEDNDIDVDSKILEKLQDSEEDEITPDEETPTKNPDKKILKKATLSQAEDRPGSRPSQSN